jgi:hypothetical protein
MIGLEVLSVSHPEMIVTAMKIKKSLAAITIPPPFHRHAPFDWWILASSQSPPDRCQVFFFAISMPFFNNTRVYFNA